MIKPDDTCVIRIARSEMGQGTLTGLAQLVAEELECDWTKVPTEFPTPGQSLARKRAWGEMGTGGSRGIRTSEDYVRQRWRRRADDAAAGGGGRVEGSGHASSTVADGVITHAASKRTTTYGKVAAAAAKLPAPDPATHQAQGSEGLEDRRQADETARHGEQARRQPRLRDRRQAAGHALRGDQGLPGLRRQARELRRIEVAGRPGSPRAVKVDDTTVAVVADTWWRAKTALEALPIVWDEGPARRSSSATIAAHLKEGLTARRRLRDAPGRRRAEGDRRRREEVEAVYGTPFLAHATMEPMNCTAKITAERAEVWVPTQNGEASLAALSEASGLPLEKCEVYKHTLGGGFGRRGGAQDYVRQAVAIAKQFPGVPIKMIWSREEDMTHDFYRPISQCRLAAGLDESGKLVGLHVRVSGQSINAFNNQAAAKDGKDDRQLQGYYAEPGDASSATRVPNLLHRVRDAQYARAGRAVARCEHQPERRLHGVLHRRGRRALPAPTRSSSAAR